MIICGAYLPISPECRIYASVNYVSIGLDNCLSPIRRQNHYLNQSWVIFNWNFRNKPEWNFSQNSKLFIHENASIYIVGEMVAILSRVVKKHELPDECVCATMLLRYLWQALHHVIVNPVNIISFKRTRNSNALPMSRINTTNFTLMILW